MGQSPMIEEGNMANYEDYAQKYQDSLQEEISDAEDQQQNRQELENSGEAIPERFKGKSAEEIARSYEELERAFSRQGNDLGELRRTVDEFWRLQSEESNKPTPQEVEPVTIDDLYESTDEAIRRVVNQEAGSRIEALEQALEAERTKARLAELDSKYDGWRATAESPEFADWVNQAPYRARMAAEARERGDVDAADALLAMYYDTREVSSQKRAVRQDQALRDATLESGGPEVPAEVQTYSRADLMNRRVAAKRGDPDAIAWLTQHQESIAIAYEEGHITD